MMRTMRKLDQCVVAGMADEQFYQPQSIRAHQVAVYVMCGGGMMGRLAADHPADFYIDSRVGRLPYSKREIEQAVETLVTLAIKAGLDPHNMPKMPNFHSCGIF